mmetsp:Transcript_9885/g.9619  ORF Transcript_9885/g.9619 Transcript_9885/m.9619 type:complete len:126 (-) Transcript_9885:6-383(-)
MKIIYLFKYCFCFLCFQFLFLGIIGKKTENTNANCIKAVADIKRNGDGSSVASCMSCDPTKKDCFFNCQAKIDLMYKYCADGSLPDGYYYDPKSLLKDSWTAVLPEIKIAVDMYTYKCIHMYMYI